MSMSGSRHCSVCEEVTPHNGVTSEEYITWICTKCGATNGVDPRSLYP